MRERVFEQRAIPSVTRSLQRLERARAIQPQRLAAFGALAFGSRGPASRLTALPFRRSDLVLDRLAFPSSRHLRIVGRPAGVV